MSEKTRTATSARENGRFDNKIDGHVSEFARVDWIARKYGHPGGENGLLASGKTRATRYARIIGHPRDGNGPFVSVKTRGTTSARENGHPSGETRSDVSGKTRGNRHARENGRLGNIIGGDTSEFDRVDTL